MKNAYKEKNKAVFSTFIGENTALLKYNIKERTFIRKIRK